MVASQLRADGRLSHLLTLDGLPAEKVKALFGKAEELSARLRAGGGDFRPLRGRLIVNIFFESSTRTRTAFEATEKQLGADVVNLDRASMAGETKRESLADTVRTVAAMGAAGIVLRHGEDGAAAKAAAAAPPGLSVINGGDGCNAHPTQGLTDAYTLWKHFGDDWPALKVAIVGDALHSRVARSDAHILRALGVKDIRLFGPPAFCPPSLAESLGAAVLTDAEDLGDMDVVILLRIQRERLADGMRMSAAEYFAEYGMSGERLARLKKTAVIMHPGPINRGVEIADAVADGARSLILRQVANGMAIRAAVLADIFGGAAEMR